MNQRLILLGQVTVIWRMKVKNQLIKTQNLSELAINTFLTGIHRSHYLNRKVNLDLRIRIVKKVCVAIHSYIRTSYSPRIHASRKKR